MNAKTSVFVICVKAIIYLPLYDLHDCTFKKPIDRYSSGSMCLRSNHQNRYCETFNKHLKNSQKGVYL